MARGPARGPSVQTKPRSLASSHSRVSSHCGADQPFRAAEVHRHPVVRQLGARRRQGGPALDLGGEPRRVLQDHHTEAPGGVQRAKGVVEAPPALLQPVAAHVAGVEPPPVAGLGPDLVLEVFPKGVGQRRRLGQQRPRLHVETEPLRCPRHPLAGQVGCRGEPVGGGDLGQGHAAAVERQPLASGHRLSGIEAAVANQALVRPRRRAPPQTAALDRDRWRHQVGLQGEERFRHSGAGKKVGVRRRDKGRCNWLLT